MQQPSKAKALISSLHKILDENKLTGGMSEEDFVSNMRNPKFADSAYKMIVNQDLLEGVESFDQFYRPFQEYYAESKKKAGTPDSGAGLPGAEVRDGFVVGQQPEQPIRQIPRREIEAQDAGVGEVQAAGEPVQAPERANIPAPIAPGREAEYVQREQQRQAYGFPGMAQQPESEAAIQQRNFPGFPTQEQQPFKFSQKESDFPIKSANAAIKELEEARADRRQGQRTKPTDAQAPIPESKVASFFDNTRVGQFLSQGLPKLGATAKSFATEVMNAPELLANTIENISLEFADNDLEDALKAGKITQEDFNAQKNVMRQAFRDMQNKTGVAVAQNAPRALEWVMDNYLNADELEESTRRNLEKVSAKVKNADVGVEKLFNQGRYADAVQLAATEVVGSLPYTISAMLGGGFGVFASGAALAQNKYRQIEETGVDMGAKESLNAVATGITEGLSEAVSAGIAKQAGKLVAKLGKEAATTTLKQQFKELGKRLIGSALEEGGSEVLAQLAENVIDKVTIDPNKNLSEGLFDAGFVGMIGGVGTTAAIGGAGLAVNRAMKGRAGEAQATTPTAPEPTTPDGQDINVLTMPQEGEPVAPGTPVGEGEPTTPEPTEPAQEEITPEVQRYRSLADDVLLGTGRTATDEAVAQELIDEYLDTLSDVDDETGAVTLPKEGTEERAIYNEVMVNRDNIAKQIIEQSKSKEDATKEGEVVQPKGGEQQYPGTEKVGEEATAETNTGDSPLDGGVQPGEEAGQEGEGITPAEPEPATEPVAATEPEPAMAEPVAAEPVAAEPVAAEPIPVETATPAEPVAATEPEPAPAKKTKRTSKKPPSIESILDSMKPPVYRMLKPFSVKARMASSGFKQGVKTTVYPLSESKTTQTEEVLNAKPGSLKNPIMVHGWGTTKMFDVNVAEENDAIEFLVQDRLNSTDWNAPSTYASQSMKGFLEIKDIEERKKAVEEIWRKKAKENYDRVKKYQKVANRLGVDLYIGTHRSEMNGSMSRYKTGAKKETTNAFVYINATAARDITIQHELAHAVLMNNLLHRRKADTPKNQKEQADRLLAALNDALISTNDFELTGLLDEVEMDFYRRGYPKDKLSEEFFVEYIAQLHDRLRGKLLDNSVLGKLERAVNKILDAILGKGLLSVRFSQTQDFLDFISKFSQGVHNNDVESLDQALEMFAQGKVDQPTQGIYWKQKQVVNSEKIVNDIIQRIEKGDFKELKGAESIVNEILAGVFDPGRFILKLTGKANAKGFFKNISTGIEINGAPVPSSHIVKAEILLAVNDYLETIATAKEQIENDLSEQQDRIIQEYFDAFPPEKGGNVELTAEEQRMVESMQARLDEDAKIYDARTELVNIPTSANQDNLKGKPMTQRVRMLHERTGSIPSVAAITTATSPDPHGMYSIAETMQSKVNAIRRGALDKKDAVKAIFAHAFGDAKAHLEAVMANVKILNPALFHTAKEAGKNYYMLDGHAAASLLLNSEAGQEYVENIANNAVTTRPIEKTAQDAGVTVSDFKGLYQVNRDVFKLNRVQSLASAIATDRMIGQMASRARVSKSEIYKKLNFKKANVGSLAQKPGILYQINAWHGSPYLFDKFTTDAIGAGEGSQAFGWGLYFTDLKDIGVYYAKKLTELKVKEVAKASFLDENVNVLDRKTIQEAINKLGQEITVPNKLARSGEAKTQSLVDMLRKEPIALSIGEYPEITPEVAERIKKKLDDKMKVQYDVDREYDDDEGVVEVPFTDVIADTYYSQPDTFGKITKPDTATIIERIRSMVTGTQKISYGMEIDSIVIDYRDEIIRIFNQEGLFNKTDNQIIDALLMYNVEDYYKMTAFSDVALDDIENNIEKIKQIFKEVNIQYEKNEYKRTLYRLSLFKNKTPDQYKLLELEKSAKQYEWILDELNDEQRQKVFPNGFDANETGKTLYGKLSDLFGDRGASMFLLLNGIEGIKYESETLSRAGTNLPPRGYNYIVFDDSAVNIEEVIRFQKDAVAARGAAMISMDGQATIYALTSPNVSTPLHELAHVYEHYMTTEERNTVINAAGTKGWTTETSEYFARGFEKYLADGVAPSATMNKIFAKFKQWLTEIYNGITGSEIDVALNDDMRKIYAQMLGFEPNLNKPEVTEQDTTSFEQDARQVLAPFGIDADVFFKKVSDAMEAYSTGGIKAAEKSLGSGKSLHASILGMGDVSKSDAAGIEKHIEKDSAVPVKTTGFEGLDSRADAIASALNMDKGLVREAMRQMAARHLTEPADAEAFEDALVITDGEFYGQLSQTEADVPEIIESYSMFRYNPYADEPYYKQASNFIWNELSNGTPDKKIVEDLVKLYATNMNGFDARDFFEFVSGRKYREQVDLSREVSDAQTMFFRNLLRLNIKGTKLAISRLKKLKLKDYVRDEVYEIGQEIFNDLAMVRKLQRDVERKAGSLMPEEKSAYQKMQLYVSAAASEIQKFTDRFYGNKKTTTTAGIKDSFISRLARSGVKTVNEFNAFLTSMHKQERIDRLIDIQERFLYKLYEDYRQTAASIGAAQGSPIDLSAIPDYDEKAMLDELSRGYDEAVSKANKKLLAKKLSRFNKEVQSLNVGYQRKDVARREFIQYLTNKGVKNPASVKPGDLKGMPEFADHFAFMDEFKNMQKEYLDILYETGQLNEERYDHLLNGTSTESGVVWEYYVPLIYDEYVYGDEIGVAVKPSDTLINRLGIKPLTKLMGKKKATPPAKPTTPISPLLYEDINMEKPVEVLFHRMTSAIRLKHRNDAIKTMARLMQESKDPNFKIFSSRVVSKKDRWGNSVGVTDLITPEIKNQSQVFFEDGKRKYIYFSNPDSPILKKLKGGLDDSNAFERLFRHVNNLSRGLFTSYRPSFIVNSLIRDAQEAAVNIQVEGRTFNANNFRPGTPEFKRFRNRIVKAYGKRYLQAAKYMTQNLFNRQGDPQMNSYYQELQQLGGLMSWSFSSMDIIRDQVEAVKENIQYAERFAAGKTKGEYTKRFLTNTFIESIHNLSNNIEAFARLATYAAMRDVGVEPIRAAEMAKNVTINFEKKGANKTIRSMSGIFLFLNPALQGVGKMGKQVASPEGRKALLAYAGLAFTLRSLVYSLPGMVGWITGDDEDEEKVRTALESYFFSQYVSESKLLIPNPLDAENPLMLPKPFGAFRISAAIGEGIADLAFGYKTPGDVTENLLRQMKASIDVIGGTASPTDQPLAYMPVPILSPVYETVANQDRFGRAIVYDISGSFDFTKANKNTPQIYKDIARETYINTPNHMDFSPASLEHIFEEYMGLGAAQFIKNSREVIKDVAAEEDKGKAAKRFFIETAFINRVLYNDNISKDDKNDLYNYLSMATTPLGRWNETKVKYAEKTIELAREKELVNENVLQSSLDDVLTQIVTAGKLNELVPGQEMTWEQWYSYYSNPKGNKTQRQIDDKIFRTIQEVGVNQR